MNEVPLADSQYIFWIVREYSDPPLRKRSYSETGASLSAAYWGGLPDLELHWLPQSGPLSFPLPRNYCLILVEPDSSEI